MVWVRAAVLCWYTGSLKLGQLLLPSLEESNRDSVKLFYKLKAVCSNLTAAEGDTKESKVHFWRWCFLKNRHCSKEEVEPECAIESVCKKQHLGTNPGSLVPLITANYWAKSAGVSVGNRYRGHCGWSLRKKKLKSDQTHSATKLLQFICRQINEPLRCREMNGTVVIIDSVWSILSHVCFPRTRRLLGAYWISLCKRVHAPAQCGVEPYLSTA